MEIKFCEFGFLRWPSGIFMPAIGTALESTGLPIRVFSHAVLGVAEESSFDVLAKLARRFMPAKGNAADRVALGRFPVPVKPRARDNKVCVVGIVLLGMPENLPWTPGIFLVPEAGYVEVRDRRSVQLTDPRFFLPEVVVIRVFDGIVPVGDFAVKIFFIDVRERAKIEIPLEGIVGLEFKISVLVLVRLFEHGIFESVTFAQCAIPVIVVVHPLVHWRGLFADRFQRGVRM